jgi:hypothetical protein
VKRYRTGLFDKLKPEAIEEVLLVLWIGVERGVNAAQGCTTEKL